METQKSKEKNKISLFGFEKFLLMESAMKNYIKIDFFKIQIEIHMLLCVHTFAKNNDSLHLIIDASNK